MDIREKVARAIDSEAFDRFDTSTVVALVINAFLEAAAELDKHGRTWHMRPDEATEEMIRNAFGTDGAQGWRKTAYRAMFAAAPEFEWDKKTSAKPGKPPPGGI